MRKTSSSVSPAYASVAIVPAQIATYSGCDTSVTRERHKVHAHSTIHAAKNSHAILGIGERLSTTKRRIKSKIAPASEVMTLAFPYSDRPSFLSNIDAPPAARLARTYAKALATAS